MKNLPYLLPLISERTPTAIVVFGSGHNNLAGELATACGAPVTIYDPAIPEFSSKPESAFDLLVTVNLLSCVSEKELEPIIADMAAFARNAIIVIDTGSAVLNRTDGRETPATQHDQDWWAARLGQHFPYLEPFRLHRNRGIAFKTWRSDESRALPNFIIRMKAVARGYWQRISGPR